jgi:hypothetical protein
MIDEVKERTLRAQIERARLEEIKKMEDKAKVKQMLDYQVRELAKKRTIENKVNPEDASYSFIASMFRPKEQTFDKQLYKDELGRQAEEHRLRKLKQNHMSEEEYKINMNQLSVFLHLSRKQLWALMPKIIISIDPWAPLGTIRSSSSTTSNTASKIRTPI